MSDTINNVKAVKFDNATEQSNKRVAYKKAGAVNNLRKKHFIHLFKNIFKPLVSCDLTVFLIK